MSKKEAQEHLANRERIEQEKLEVLIRTGGSVSVARGDEETIEDLKAAAKAWTNAHHATQRARKRLREA